MDVEPTSLIVPCSIGSSFMSCKITIRSRLMHGMNRQRTINGIHLTVFDGLCHQAIVVGGSSDHIFRHGIPIKRFSSDTKKIFGVSLKQSSCKDEQCSRVITERNKQLVYTCLDLFESYDSIKDIKRGIKSKKITITIITIYWHNY